MEPTIWNFAIVLLGFVITIALAIAITLLSLRVVDFLSGILWARYEHKEVLKKAAAEAMRIKQRPLLALVDDEQPESI